MRQEFSYNSILLSKKLSTESKKILVTCALPYTNGPIHIGHMLEHIQADIWVRNSRLQGNTTLFFCADDTHGTATMIRAETQNKTPEELIKDDQLNHICLLYTSDAADE